jgi:alkylhydroperoxidase/carboxymuconolactone decarboxylase family protein YurZ
MDLTSWWIQSKQEAKRKVGLELTLHTCSAINNGLSEVEIREAVQQATVYCVRLPE